MNGGQRNGTNAQIWESKTTRIMMATVPHVTFGLGRRKFQADGFLLTRVYKGVPRQAEVTQGVPGRFRPRIFLTFRHCKGDRSSTKGTGRLYPRKYPWYSLSEAESTAGHMVLSGVPRKKSPVTPPGIDPATVGLVARCLNHYATPGPIYFCTSGSFLMYLSFHICPTRTRLSQMLRNLNKRQRRYKRRLK